MLAVVFFHASYTGWFSFFLLLFSLLFPVFSLLVSLRSMRRAAYEVQLPVRCFCEDAVQYRLLARHTAGIPVSCCKLRLCTYDAVDAAQKDEWLSLGGTLGFSRRVDTRHAGVQTFRVEKAWVYDALGLFRLRLPLPQACSIAVEPRPQPPTILPNLSQFQYRVFQPKPGGGFSEVHELREYRPGDSLREIHWKLSAKTDTLMVREAQEARLGLIVLSFDFSGTRTQLDSTLRQLLWLSGWLTDRQIPHRIDWLEPATLQPRSADIHDANDRAVLLEKLLQTKRAEHTPSIASRIYANADWRYHIQPKGESRE